MRSLQKKSGGYMMIEILVAITIIAGSVLAAMAVSQKALQVSRQAVHSAQAAFLLEEGAEVARIVRDNGWANISGLATATDLYPTFSGGTWTLSTTPNTVGIFTRTVELENVTRDDTTKDIATTGTTDLRSRLVTVMISWQEGGMTLTKSMQFYLMDIFS